MTDPATTPVIFTRGLQANGTWSATAGVYRDTGGYIAFLGGNIAFYPNISTAATSPLFSNNPTSTSQTKPIDVRQAIPFNTVAASNGRIYGIPPTTGGASGPILGSANGTVATRGP